VDVDAIAVTQGPGQALALEIGIKHAKKLAKKYDKPLIAVSHMEGHLLASFAQNSHGKGGITADSGKFPLMGLLVSGGHTQLVLMSDFGKYELLGETLDDAAGEAFDKVGRMLGIGYPGGPVIEQLAKEGDENTYDLPVPMIKRKELQFSYSGIKTSVLYKVRDLEKNNKLNGKAIKDMAASFQRVMAKSLVIKLEMAVEKYKVKGILLGGGVISNIYIRNRIRQAMRRLNLPVYIPYNKKLLTDNAAMIGVVAYYKAKRGEYVKDIDAMDRKPNLSFDKTQTS
jgi:N6-L-threonylcarbamoyladenine synthase